VIRQPQSLNRLHAIIVRSKTIFAQRPYLEGTFHQISEMTTSPFWQRTEDWHRAGEPFRIVSELPTNALTQDLTVSQQRRKILSTPSHPLDLRQSLCHEPRGSSAMYGSFILPPNDAEAHFGVLFWHKDGFSTACGHSTIALGYWTVANGLVQRIPSGTVDIVIDVPSGRVTARATFDELDAVVAT
jgi:trans-L-3-hydroxyproline dehydratase